MNGTETAEAPTPKTRASAKTENGNKLNAADRAELVRLEKVLHRHFETFKEAGHALTIIRDKRLYRETHATFELYCRDKWGTSKTQANRLIAAAKVVDNLKGIGGKQAEDLTESSVRALTGLNPQQQKKVFKQVVATAPAATGITAKLVSDTARAIAPEAFTRARPTVPDGKGPKGRVATPSDFIRKSELLDEISAWRKEKAAAFAAMKPDAVLNGVRAIIKRLS